MLIRPAALGDLPAIRRIAAEAPEAAQWSASQWEALFREGSSRVVLVAEVGESSHPIFGFLVASTAAEEWELENMAVASESRRQGVGRRLVEELIRLAETRGGRAVHLEVRAANRAARGLYEGCGFRQMGVRPHYYDCPADDAILYSLEFTKKSAGPD